MRGALGARAPQCDGCDTAQSVVVMWYGWSTYRGGSVRCHCVSDVRQCRWLSFKGKLMNASFRMCHVWDLSNLRDSRVKVPPGNRRVVSQVNFHAQGDS